jgi:hypothetical protein
LKRTSSELIFGIISSSHGLTERGYFLAELCNAKLNFLNLLHREGAISLPVVRTCFASDAGLEAYPPAIEMACARRAGCKTKGKSK